MRIFPTGQSATHVEALSDSRQPRGADKDETASPHHNDVRLSMSLYDFLTLGAGVILTLCVIWRAWVRRSMRHAAAFTLALAEDKEIPLARARTLEGMLTMMARNCERALGTHDPLVFMLRRQAAELRVTGGDMPGAISDYDKLAARYPDHPDSLDVLIRLVHLQKQAADNSRLKSENMLNVLADTEVNDPSRSESPGALSRQRFHPAILPYAVAGLGHVAIANSCFRNYGTPANLVGYIVAAGALASLAAVILSWKESTWVSPVAGVLRKMWDLPGVASAIALILAAWWHHHSDNVAQLTFILLLCGLTAACVKVATTALER